jgi:selenocysteine lyase/cysteine desulfurase
MLTPYDARAGIITIDARDPKALVSELAAQRIVVAQRGGVRVSPHVWNTKEELDAAVEAIVAADAR